MPLLISKDGKQLGPYTMDEARSLVLSGQLDAEDWAWPDGATEWVALRDVSGFTAAKPTRPAAAPAPATATPAAVEEKLWSGHPSQMLNFSIYIFWGAVLILTVLGLFLADNVFSESPLWGFTITGVVALIALINSAAAYLHLHAIEYVISTQRVRIVPRQGHHGAAILSSSAFRAGHNHHSQRRRAPAAPGPFRHSRRRRTAREIAAGGHDPPATFRCS
jgi:hypothetical protein